MFKKHFGASHGKNMMISLKSTVDKYNKDCESKCALIEVLEDGNFVISIVSPLMKRIMQGLKKVEKFCSLIQLGMFIGSGVKYF